MLFAYGIINIFACVLDAYQLGRVYMLALRWDRFLQISRPVEAPADWPLGQCCRIGCRR